MSMVTVSRFKTGGLCLGIHDTFASCIFSLSNDAASDLAHKLATVLEDESRIATNDPPEDDLSRELHGTGVINAPDESESMEDVLDLAAEAKAAGITLREYPVPTDETYQQPVLDEGRKGYYYVIQSPGCRRVIDSAGHIDKAMEELDSFQVEHNLPRVVAVWLVVDGEPRRVF